MHMNWSDKKYSVYLSPVRTDKVELKLEDINYYVRVMHVYIQAACIYTQTCLLGQTW